MRTLVVLAIVGVICGGCGSGSNRKGEREGPSESCAPRRDDRPENAYPYESNTLERFERLSDSDDWRQSTWNARGMLEIVHVKTGLIFVLVPGGSFKRKSTIRRIRLEPFYEITVSPFLLSRTECSQEAWDRVGGTDERRFAGKRLPIGSLSWLDSRRWCTNAGLRFPSEAEWEYACRAGTETLYWSGDGESDLLRVAWCRANSEMRPHRVGEKEANAFGLHDVHGNVWEWCEDTNTGGYAYQSAPTDGTADVREGAKYRAIRGGSWRHGKLSARSTSRISGPPEYRRRDLGFRPAASLPE